jgi:MYXO-CTERM domain-containing protein
MRLNIGMLVVALLTAGTAKAQTLAAGAPSNNFTLTVFVSGASQITDFRFLPDGRVVFTQKTGEVMVRLTNGTVVQAGSFPVDTDSEKGLLGVEPHPQFGQGTNRTLFFYYSLSDAAGGTDLNRHRVVSITLADNNTLTANTETVLLQNLRGPANHDGGGLAIGPDGKLYVGVGDTGCNSNLPPGGTITNYTATCLTQANGKILRINLDGTIPADNPLVGRVVPACDSTSCNANPVPVSYTGVPRTEIWSWGFRNPFRFSFDQTTGNLWVGDVGEVTYEEVNLVTKGQHYGYPYREGAFGYPLSTCATVGPQDGGAHCVDPKYFCLHGAASGGIDGNCESITGGTFLDSPSWPAAFRGLYYFGDNVLGTVWTLTPNAARDGFVSNPRVVFASGFGTPVRFIVGPDGNLYIANYTDNTIVVISPQPGVDAGPPPDAGADGGTSDGGADAGPRPDAGTPLDAGPIDFGGGTPPGGLAGGVPFNGPDVCKACHDRKSGDADAGQLYMPYDGWVSTMMGNAIRDPLFQAALTVANQDVVGIGQWCLRCHSPSSYVTGHGLPPDGSALDAVDRSGVSCEVCHRSKTGADGTALVGNAQLLFETSLLVHGPYDTTASPAHSAVLDPFTSSSALCGQCHQVSNPVIKVAGTDRPFPLDTTYSEWEQSSFSAGATAMSCQQCHMEVFPGDHVVGGQGGGPRSNPRQHTFVGGNVWGLDAVLAASPDLAPYADAFAATQASARRNLAAAAEITISLPPGALPSSTMVPVTVQVRNLTGHKLPTGYADGRRVFIELSVNGQVVSGAYDGDAGTLLADGQLEVFEAAHGQADGGTDHLALHDTVLKDTRVPPLGFQPTADTAPVGTTYLTDADGGALGIAQATYQVLMPPFVADAGVVITARLFHQSTTRHYVEALQTANGTDDTGSTLLSIYSATGMAPPVEMTSAEVTAPLGPGSVTGGCGCTSAGGSTTALAVIVLGVVAVGARRRRRAVGAVAASSKH